MQITTSRAELAAAVTWTQQAIGKRVLVPILAGMSCEVADGQLHLAAFDYDTSCRATVPGDDAEPGRILITGAALAKAVKALPARKTTRVTLAASWPQPEAAPEQPAGELHEYGAAQETDSSWRITPACSCGWIGEASHTSGGARDNHGRHVSDDAPLVAAWRRAEAEAGRFRPGSLTITCEGTTSRLAELDASEYPALPPIPEASGTMAGVAFGGAVTRVARAAGTDDTLPVLTCVLMEADGRTITFAATDRYRLHAEPRSWIPADDESRAMAFPARTLAAFAKAAGKDGKITVHYPADGSALAGLSCDRFQVTARVCEGEFPRYRKLWPARAFDEIAADAGQLAVAVKRAGNAAERNAAVSLTCRPDSITVEASAEGETAYSETVPADGISGVAIRLALNPAYLGDALAGIAGPVSIGCNGYSKPVTFDGAGAYRALVMQLNNRGDDSEWKRYRTSIETGETTCLVGEGDRPGDCTSHAHAS